MMLTEVSYFQATGYEEAKAYDTNLYTILNQ